MSRNPLSGLACLALFAALAACRQPDPMLHFAVMVDDAKGIQPGQPVVLDGLTIGSVHAVTTESGGQRIEVQIEPEYRARVQKEFFFRVESNTRGSVLRIEDSGEGKNPVGEGDLIDARASWFDRLASGAKKLSSSAGEALDNLKATIENTATAIEESPEAQALKESLSELGRDLASAARGRYQHFVEKDIPELEKKAEAYRDKLIREGRTEEAEVFWKWYSRLSGAIKEAVAETGQEEPPEKDPG